MMNRDNPYAAPQTVDTREVSPPDPPAPLAPENRDFRWLKRGLGSLAMVLSPLTIALVVQFKEFAVLGLSVILPFCCGMLAAVPPRTPGRDGLIVAALAQAVGCFCLFVMVLMPMHDQDEYRNRFENLSMIAGVAEAVCWASILLALIRLGHWLQDRWYCQLCSVSLGCGGLYILSVFLFRNEIANIEGRGIAILALLLALVIGYLTFWAALMLGLRFPRMISAKIPDPPRFE